MPPLMFFTRNTRSSSPLRRYFSPMIKRWKNWASSWKEKGICF